MFALGVALAAGRYDTEELHHILFGDLLRIGRHELPFLALVAAAVVGGPRRCSTRSWSWPPSIPATPRPSACAPTGSATLCFS